MPVLKNPEMKFRFAGSNPAGRRILVCLIIKSAYKGKTNRHKEIHLSEKMATVDIYPKYPYAIYR